jgi:hypothetical protein
MRPKAAKHATNSFATRVGRSLRRAQIAARKTARMHGTPIYFLRMAKLSPKNPNDRLAPHDVVEVKTGN